MPNTDIDRDQLILLIDQREAAEERESRARFTMTQAQTDPTLDREAAQREWARAFNDLMKVNAELIPVFPEFFREPIL